MSEIKYSPVLAKYYRKWFSDCHDSAIYCRKHDNELGAQMYLSDASRYLTIIMENYDEIEKLTPEEWK